MPEANPHDAKGYRLFFEQFGFQRPALVNFVGGGGKTSLILRLMEECSRPGPVIYTTTTRIHPPNPGNGMAIIASDNVALLKRLVERASHDCWEQVGKLVVTRPALSRDLLRGVQPDFAQSLDRSLCPLIFNEADGARSMSLKMPREGEPVLMNGAEYLVPVIGIDCLMKPLGPGTLFRWDYASARYGLEAGRLITPQLAASLLLHPQGVCRGWATPVRIVPYINKVDDESWDSLAGDLAQALLHNSDFHVTRVVFGSLLQGRASSLSPHRE